jgi:hypothetical protein
MEVDVEVVDAPLDYNLLLGCNWTYAMTSIVSSILCTLCFPHEGKIVMIDQLSFTHAIPSASIGPSIPVIENSQSETEDVGVEMYSSLMGSFDFLAPIHHIHAISSEPSSSMRFVPFCTSYFNYPWTLPSLNMSCEVQSHIGMEMPLSEETIVYQYVLNTIVDLDPFTLQTNEEDLVLEPVWVVQYSC